MKQNNNLLIKGLKGLKILGLLNVLRINKIGTTTVLCFHRVSNEISNSWQPLSPEIFEKIIQYLKQNYTIIALNEFYKDFGNKKKALITFDDGYQDFYSNAFPILKKHNIPAVLSIVTNSIETGNYIWTQRLNKILEKINCLPNFEFYHQPTNININCHEIINLDKYAVNIFLKLLHLSPNLIINFIDELEKNIPQRIEHTPMMTWQQIKEVGNNNIYIASHTHSHCNLSLIKDDTIIEEELSKSKAIIKEKIGIDTDCIAFPNGMYNQNTINLAIKHGYKYLLAIDEKTNKKQNTNNIIYRQLIEHNSLLENLFKIEGAYNILRKLK